MLFRLRTLRKLKRITHLANLICLTVAGREYKSLRFREDREGNMLKIKITHLTPGVHEFALDPEAEELNLDSEQFSGIHVDVRLDYHEDRILVYLQTAAVATLECDRTLQLYEQPVTGTYTMLFGSPDMVESSGDDVSDVQVLRPTDQEIDLSEAVRETILLSLPVRRLAPGAEDIEIPTSFGALKNKEGEEIDPRWEVLRKLSSEDEE